MILQMSSPFVLSWILRPVFGFLISLTSLIVSSSFFYFILLINSLISFSFCLTISKISFGCWITSCLISSDKFYLYVWANLIHSSNLFIISSFDTFQKLTLNYHQISQISYFFFLINYVSFDRLIKNYFDAWSMKSGSMS